MAEMTIQCPRCGQHITCDELWCGHQIQCPSCQAAFNVAPKQAAPAPAPPPAAAHNVLVPKVPTGGSRLSAGATQVARAIPTSQAQAAAATEKLVSKGKKSNKVLQWVGYSVTLIVVAAGGYFGYQYYQSSQEKANAKPPEASAKHGNRKGPRNPEQPAAAEGAVADAADPAAAPATPPPPKELPTVPPVYTLELGKAKIPESKVNGKITGTNFVAETVRLDPGVPSHVLRFTQGSLTSPDREILVYLRLKPGESATNQNWTVAPDTRSTVVSQVAKRWKTNPKYAPQLKSFYTGYALKLETGKMSEDGAIEGKIYLALPDAEQSVVAGVFKAASTPQDPNAQPAVMPTATPTGPSPAERSAFERRYGRPR